MPARGVLRLRCGGGHGDLRSIGGSETGGAGQEGELGSDGRCRDRREGQPPVVRDFLDLEVDLPLAEKSASEPEVVVLVRRFAFIRVGCDVVYIDVERDAFVVVARVRGRPCGSLPCRWRWCGSPGRGLAPA